MKTSMISLAFAAAFFAMAANAQHSGTAGGDSADAVPGSNRNPSPGAVPPPGQGQGTGMSGQSGGHMMMGGQGGHMMGSMSRSMEGMFDQMDRNRDGVISREEWNAMHGGASASGSSQHEGHHPATPGSSR